MHAQKVTNFRNTHIGWNETCYEQMSVVYNSNWTQNEKR